MNTKFKELENALAKLTEKAVLKEITEEEE